MIVNLLWTGERKLPRVRFLAAGIVALAIFTGWAWSTRPNAVAIILDNQQVTVLNNRQEAIQLTQQLVAEKSASMGREVRYRGEMEFRPIRVQLKDKPVADMQRQLLADKLQFVTDATGMLINGEVKLVVTDEEAGRNVLNDLKEKFRPQAEGIIIDQMDLEEEVALVPSEVSPAEIKGSGAALEYLLNGTMKLEKYRAKAGDSLWTIAKSREMSVQDLMNANPQLTSDKLAIGQELNLVKPEPLIHVSVAYRRTVTEYTPYPIKYRDDANTYRGQQRVVQSGKEGKKEVQYRIVERNGIRLEKEVLSEKLLAEPVTRIVARGSKILLASRGGGGSGELIWPLRGPITSRFGPRKGGFHHAIDIDGVTGDPVVSAEGGVVTFVGTVARYGKRIVIDHGDGLQTAYSHLSAYRVKVGDKVSRGTIIGLVGSTGRSTGSHLDFEVKINGNFRNPLDYLP